VQSFRSALPSCMKGVHVGVNIRSAVSERVCPLSYSAAGGTGEACCYMQPLYSGFGTARCGQFQGEPLPEMANTSFGIEATALFLGCNASINETSCTSIRNGSEKFSWNFSWNRAASKQSKNRAFTRFFDVLRFSASFSGNAKSNCSTQS